MEEFENVNKFFVFKIFKRKFCARTWFRKSEKTWFPDKKRERERERKKKLEHIGKRIDLNL